MEGKREKRAAANSAVLFSLRERRNGNGAIRAGLSPQFSPIPPTKYPARGVMGLA
jgi:hypothetical protein